MEKNLLGVEKDLMADNQSTNNLLIVYKVKKDFVPGEKVHTFFKRILKKKLIYSQD